MIPGVTSRVVSDLIPDVIDALQGRSDVSNVMAARYIRRATQEITASYPFEELRTTGPLTLLTPDISVYLATNFVNVGDDLTIVESFALFVDFPQNTIIQPIKYRTPAAIEPMIQTGTPGLPGFWTRYGRNIHFGPNPNNPYTVFMRYQIRHPFPEDVNALPGAALLFPADWEDIISYAAAERIAIVKRWNDQATFLHDKLYGDPEYVTSQGKSGRPGLIAAKLMQVERDQMFNSRQFSIVVPSYRAR